MKTLSALQEEITRITGVEHNGNLMSMSMKVTIGGHAVGHLVHNHHAGEVAGWSGKTPEEVIAENGLTGELTVTSKWAAWVNVGMGIPSGKGIREGTIKV